MRGLSHELIQLETQSGLQQLNLLNDEVDSQDISSDLAEQPKDDNSIAQEARLLSLGRDNSIRVWGKEPLIQAYEFECRKNDECLSIVFVSKESFLGGFESGMVRLFDLNQLAVVCEKKLFKSSILNITCAPIAKLAIAGDEYGNYKVVDLKSKCAQLCAIDSEDVLLGPMKKVKSSSSISKNEKIIALLANQNKEVSLHDTVDFKVVSTISLGSDEAHTVIFSNLHQKDLFVLTCTKAIKVYQINEGFKINLVREIASCHKFYISALVPIYKNQVFATAGGDGKIKIWGLYDNDEYGCFQGP